MIPITATIAIDENLLRWHFIHASGPGGQHVNKVATGVQLHFQCDRCDALTPAVKGRLKRLAGNRLTKDGRIVIAAHRHRSQRQNREEALERLVALIRQAARPPVRRRPTRPSRVQRRRRLADKRHRSLVKQRRRRPPNDGD